MQFIDGMGLLGDEALREVPVSLIQVDIADKRNPNYFRLDNSPWLKLISTCESGMHTYFNFKIT